MEKMILIFLIMFFLKADGSNLEISVHEIKDRKFELVFKNQGEADVAFYDPELGYGELFLTLIFSEENGSKIYIKRKIADDITGHPFSEIVLKRNGKRCYEINMNDGAWERPVIKGGEATKNFVVEYNVSSGVSEGLLGVLGSRNVDFGYKIFEGCLKTNMLRLSIPLKKLLENEK